MDLKGLHFLVLLPLLVCLFVNRPRSTFVRWRPGPARVLRPNLVIRMFKRGQPSKTHMPMGHPFATKVSQITDRRHNLNAEPLGLNQTYIQAAQDLKSEDVTVRRAAIDILYHKIRRANSSIIMGALLDATYDEDLKVRMDAAVMLKRLSISDRYQCDQFLSRLADRLSPKSEASAFERVMTLETLGRIGKGAKSYCQYMADHLQHEDWLVRLTAVNALGDMGGEINYHKFFRAAVIRRAKTDENMEVRKAADAALRQLKPLKPGWMLDQLPGFNKRIIRNTKKGKNKR